jgi:putative DNA primase/helicase
VDTDTIHEGPRAFQQQPPKRAKKLDWATRYARLGFLVFQCHYIEPDRECSCGKLECKSAGKHPLRTGWQEEATRDEATLTEWWAEPPGANVGILCGEDSNLLVLDVDCKPNQPDGRETLRTLELEHGELPEGPVVHSPSDGAHYYFQHEPGLINETKFAPGLDIRTEGGLVIGAGSRARFRGSAGEWIEDDYVEDAVFDLATEIPSRMRKN